MKQSLKLYCVTSLIGLLAIGCSKEQLNPEQTAQSDARLSGKSRPTSPRGGNQRQSPAKDILPKFKLSPAEQQGLKATPWALVGMITTLKTQTIPSLKQKTIQLEKSILRQQEVIKAISNVQKADESALKVKNSTIAALKRELLLDTYTSAEAKEQMEKKLIASKADYNKFLSIYETNDKTLSSAQSNLRAIEKDLASTITAWSMAEQEYKAYEVLLKE